jgi:hypothetical protein
MPVGIKLQKLIVAFIVGLIAVGSGVALTHVGRAPDRTATDVDNATPTVGEGRNLTREVLRSRREHGEALAEVHPDPSLGERERIVPQEVAPKETAAKETVAAKDSKDHAAGKDAAKPKPATIAAVALPRSRPDSANEPATPDQTDANAAVAPPEEPRSFGAMVFSTVSNLSGKAANLTGDTANFVIELPGRLISAGGKLFERPQSPPPDTQPQKREAL